MPTRVLRPHPAGGEFGDAASGNLLVQGDNLEALKALLPLPTSFGRFDPDFVCELTAGRLLVVEYKGAQIRGMQKAIEKNQVGRLWAEHSGGRCCFAMVFEPEAEMNMTQQTDAALG